MKNIFELEEGKTYKVIKNDRELVRKFRVNNEKLENDGLGFFAPCDWVSLNATTKFIETYTSTSFPAQVFHKIRNLLTQLIPKKGISFLKLKEGVVYQTSNILLPKSIIRKGDKIFNHLSNEEIKLDQLSLKTRFVPV